ncbi:hypothetical protein NDU88_011358 [Pleurodeles waltl]|uniref:Uncharacterized protein n=1 Tax=Pleurodeles waltl TaxID=8319 RepID=A0AAV7QXD5_PLEWA|nr:hypothetical protein NDU88_011358 [Pleurodeles waltl]
MASSVSPDWKVQEAPHLLAKDGHLDIVVGSGESTRPARCASSGVAWRLSSLATTWQKGCLGSFTGRHPAEPANMCPLVLWALEVSTPCRSLPATQGGSHRDFLATTLQHTSLKDPVRDYGTAPQGKFVGSHARERMASW